MYAQSIWGFLHFKYSYETSLWRLIWGLAGDLWHLKTVTLWWLDTTHWMACLIYRVPIKPPTILCSRYQNCPISQIRKRHSEWFRNLLKVSQLMSCRGWMKSQIYNFPSTPTPQTQVTMLESEEQRGSHRQYQPCPTRWRRGCWEESLFSKEHWRWS